MVPDNSLHQRRRPLTEPELDAIPWLRLLGPDERERAVDDLRISEAQPGEFVCRMGRPATYWFGVVDGLLKMSTDNAEGQTMTFTGQSFLLQFAMPNFMFHVVTAYALMRSKGAPLGKMDFLAGATAS